MSKYWNVRPSKNYVVTRERGDIPGILIAQDVFVSVPMSVMRAATSVRADKICEMMEQVISGEMGRNEYMSHPFHYGDTILSVIKNPSKPYRGNHYI